MHQDKDAVYTYRMDIPIVRKSGRGVKVRKGHSSIEVIKGSSGTQYHHKS